MLAIRGPSRRDFLRLGAVGGLSLAATPRVTAASFGRAKRCLFLFLTGGPPQLDTWDLKPAAPEKVRGELKPIPTSVAGTSAMPRFQTGVPKAVKRGAPPCAMRLANVANVLPACAPETLLVPGCTHARSGMPRSRNPVKSPLASLATPDAT